MTTTFISKYRIAAALAIFIVALSAFAYEWKYEHKPLRGVYADFGGGIGDPYRPTKDDHKIMFSIDGAGAKAMFDGMGPDVKDICTPQPGERVRKRDGGRLFCMRSSNGEYQCNFGFDLRTGKSIGGIVC